MWLLCVNTKHITLYARVAGRATPGSYRTLLTSALRKAPEVGPLPLGGPAGVEGYRLQGEIPYKGKSLVKGNAS